MGVSPSTLLHCAIVRSAMIWVSTCNRIFSAYWSGDVTKPPKKCYLFQNEKNVLRDSRDLYCLWYLQINSEYGDSSADADIEKDVLEFDLTRTEFADILGLQPSSTFVRNLFLLMDKSRDGRISFHEFKTYFGILCKGKSFISIDNS